jgi:HD-GYP domain-containing protein (c-di-GMP phosphodiesterase class II)
MTTIRVAEVLASLSMVADLGFGLPPGEALRSCLIATALARQMGLADEVVSEVYYTTLLQHIGCIGFAHETSAVYGDELAAGAAAAVANEASLRDTFTTFLPRLTRGRGVTDRARAVARTMTQGATFGRRFATAACEVGSATARRLGLPEGVQRGLHEVFERWNGSGGSQGLMGDEISLPARLAQLGALASRFDDVGGADAATRAVRQRSGVLVDPAIADVFAIHGRSLLASVAVTEPLKAVLEAEPGRGLTVPASGLRGIAAVFADVVDLKSPYLHGHSSGVSMLARAAGQRLGLERDDLEHLTVAGLLHDLGRVGVPDSVWERPGPLSVPQWERVRMHAYHSERILVRSRLLEPVATIAGMHHERIDGSGYHRAARARDIPRSARVLAAADAYQALTQPRPHRGPLPPGMAADRLRLDADAGRLDRDAVSAVLQAAGQARPLRRPELPGGLSEREVQVLRALARGLSNREIANLLFISRRTAEHHVQHVYGKIGVSSRAAAALFAMEHDLLD